jgi:hypothetical protein
VPCFIKAARLLCRTDPVLNSRLRWFVGLVCGHLKSRHVSSLLAWQMGIAPHQLTGVDVRVKLPDESASHYGVAAWGRDGERPLSARAPARSLFGGKLGPRPLQVQGARQDEKRVMLLPRTLDSRELKWTIGRLRALVAARTHATIAAFSQAVPTLSIGHSQKAVGLNTDLFGHTNWVVDVCDATADRVASRVRDLLSDGDDVRRILRAQLERQMTLAANGADALRGVMT